MTLPTFSICLPAGQWLFAGQVIVLAFLIPAGFKVDDPPLPKFLIFFDNIPDSINAACALRRRLPRKQRRDMGALYDNIVWNGQYNQQKKKKAS